mmetsp:Transcript_10709/g.48258  ORF Transcript_10709/g.48258 Transcript_10709/m.48258 type:complete len:241 (+) Transcript_10709:2987-3709(+)
MRRSAPSRGEVPAVVSVHADSRGRRRRGRITRVFRVPKRAEEIERVARRRERRRRVTGCRLSVPGCRLSVKRPVRERRDVVRRRAHRAPFAVQKVGTLLDAHGARADLVAEPETRAADPRPPIGPGAVPVAIPGCPLFIPGRVLSAIPGAPQRAHRLVRVPDDRVARGGEDGGDVSRAFRPVALVRGGFHRSDVRGRRYQTERLRGALGAHQRVDALLVQPRLSRWGTRAFTPVVVVVVV